MGFQLNTDFSTIEPNQGGASYFPVSDSKGWLCQITESDSKETASKDGRMGVFTLTGLEGPVMGKTHTYRINTANPNPEAVRIGQGELSALAHVTGHLRVGNSAELHMKPFRVVIASDATEKYPDATKVTGVRDVNGNAPKSAGQGALTPATSGVVGQQGQQGGFGGQQGQGGFGGAQAGQQGFGGQQQQQGQQGGGFGGADPNAGGFQQGQQAGGFGGQQGGFQQQQQGGFGQQQGQQGQQQGGFQQQQPAGGAPNWA